MERQHAIVLRGDFNTRIFHPSWFEKHGLVRASQAKMAEESNLLIYKEIAQFSLEWAEIQVTPDRFTIKTLDDTCDDMLKDLVCGTFSLLGHTPITALGINRNIHFQAESTDKWNEIGHSLVPKSPVWDDVLEKPGTRAVVVEGKRTDSRDGYFMVKLEPSNRITSGIFLDINSHIDYPGEDKRGVPAMEVVKDLDKIWDESNDELDRITKTMMEKL